MCVNCIRTNVDITQGIPKQVAAPAAPARVSFARLNPLLHPARLAVDAGHHLFLPRL
jgi:hypothetical protein